MNFSDNQLGKSIQHILKEIPTSSLEILDISGNIIDLNSFKFPKNFNASKLKVLNFQNCRIHNYINKEELNSIFEIQSLEELNLSCSNANMNLAQLQTVGFSITENKKKDSKLTKIYLRGLINSITDFDGFAKELIPLLPNETQ